MWDNIFKKQTPEVFHTFVEIFAITGIQTVIVNESVHSTFRNKRMAEPNRPTNN